MTTSRTAGSVIPAAESLLDREAIREAMARYCRGIDPRHARPHRTRLPALMASRTRVPGRAMSPRTPA
jgi:hypothetical protein